MPAITATAIVICRGSGIPRIAVTSGSKRQQDHGSCPVLPLGHAPQRPKGMIAILPGGSCHRHEGRSQFTLAEVRCVMYLG